MNDYDAVIIGAGMGGLITGAILAKGEGMKVLLLEKEAEIGGRVISFGGPHGEYSEEEYRQLLGGCAGIRILDSYPELSKIINTGLFKNHIIDGGWHGVSAGDRCRYALVASALGKRLHVSPQIGFFYWRGGEWVEIQDYFKDWPQQSSRGRSKIASDRLRLSIDEASEYNHVSIKEYLEAMTDDQRVRDYYTTLAGFQFGINDPERISAGEWILCNNMTSATGRHLTYGGGMGDVTSGFKMIANVFAEIIRENGGEIRTKAKVKEVVIKDYRARSVVVEEKGEAKKIDAKNVISNLRMNQVFNIIPKENFPRETLERIANIFPMAGVLGHMKFKEPLETKWPKAMFVLPHLPGVELRGGEPIWGFEQTSAIDPTRLINGKGCIIQTWFGVSAKDPDEIRDMALMKRGIDAQIAFMRKQYPRFDELLDWYIIVGAEALYGINPGPGQVGDRRPSVKHPLIKNLFFTGDTVTQWDVGSSGTCHGAVICACAVSGRDYLTLLPEYMR
jgi:phytoene dehydrogenase-like protein